MSQLVTLAHSPHIAVWHRPVEVHSIAIESLQKVLGFAVEVSSRRCYVLGFAAACIASPGLFPPRVRPSEKEQRSCPTA